MALRRTVPPLTATDSADPPATSRIARSTVSVLLAPPARVSVLPSTCVKVPAARVPPPLLLRTVPPLAVMVLATLAPLVMSSVFAPSAMMLPGTPAVPAPLRRKVPPDTVVVPA